MKKWASDGIGKEQTKLGNRHEHDDLVMVVTAPLVLSSRNQTSGTAWTSLDLSSYIPAGTKAVHLKLRTKIDSYTSGDVYMSVRKDSAAEPAMQCNADTASVAADVEVETGICEVASDRTIEYELILSGTAQVDYSIRLLAYLTNIATVTLDTSGAVMKTDFDEENYGQRWQVETVFSMIKRNFGSAVRAREYWSQCREMMLLVLTHKIAIILLVKELFYRALLTPFIS